MAERPEGPGSMKTSVSWTSHIPLFSEFLIKETINALVVEATIGQFSTTYSQMHSNQQDSNQRQEDPSVFPKQNLLFTVQSCTTLHVSPWIWKLYAVLSYLPLYHKWLAKYNRYSQNNYWMNELAHIFNFHQIQECQESIIRPTFLHLAYKHSLKNCLMFN